MVSDTRFDYLAAFDRNIGFVTEAEQLRLKHKKVAIAGMGGVGGAHLLMLTRLGIGGFHLADFDHYELTNFNRQVGATMRTLTQSKVEVMTRMSLDINPDLHLKLFHEGLIKDNIDIFLEGVDLYVDGLDFFCQNVRALVFRRCAELRIPAITAAPMGMGTSYLTFMPGKMSFEEYFGIRGTEGHDDESDNEQRARFAAGLMPRVLHGKYLIDPSRIDLRQKKTSSSTVGIHLASAAVGAEATKILLGRGKVYPAPWCHQFDPYLGRWRRTYVALGHRNPIQRVRASILRRAAPTPSLDQSSVSPMSSSPKISAVSSTLERILELARWTPSGDNNQPWRFEPTGEHSVRVHLHDQRSDDVYDFDGRPSILSCGMLLETMRLAATREARRLEFRAVSTSDDQHRIDVTFPEGPVHPDPLADFILARSVDRRPYRLATFTEKQQRELEAALDSELEIRWLKTPRERMRFAMINARATAIRLRLPEAASVHSKILELDRTSCEYGIPVSALGLSPVMRGLIRAIHKQPEMATSLTRIVGAGLPALEFDLIPGLFCSSHFLITTRSPLGQDEFSGIAPILEAGMSLQRFWLRATSLGLALHPSMAPLCFAYYAEHGRTFESAPECNARAASVLRELRELTSRASPRISDHFVFAGRLGLAPEVVPQGRSLRRPLTELLLTPLDDKEPIEEPISYFA